MFYRSARKANLVTYHSFSAYWIFLSYDNILIEALINYNNYVRLRNNSDENVRWLSLVLPPGESRWICAARPIKVRKKTGQTDTNGQTDGRTDARPLGYITLNGKRCQRDKRLLPLQNKTKLRTQCYIHMYYRHQT